MELSPNSITTERRADMIWAVFMTAPLIYILTSISITEAGVLDSFDPNSLRFLVIGLSATAASVIGLIAYIQTSQRFLSSLNTGDGARRILLAFSISCVLSGAIAIYGFIPTLLSGSLQYILGFSGVSWILLVLLRIRFKKLISSLPDMSAKENRSGM